MNRAHSAGEGHPEIGTRAPRREEVQENAAENGSQPTSERAHQGRKLPRPCDNKRDNTADGSGKQSSTQNGSQDVRSQHQTLRNPEVLRPHLMAGRWPIFNNSIDMSI